MNLDKLFYNENLGKIVYTASMVTAPFIGSLPEQRWFEQNFQNYNSSIATVISASIETVFGFSYALFSDKSIGNLIGLSGLIRLMSSCLHDHDSLQSTRRGSYILELPWHLGKSVYNIRKKPTLQ